MKEGLTQYELMIIINSEIGQDAIKKQLSDIKKQLEEHGEIFFEDFWGERDLGYSMNGKIKGYYAVFDFYFVPAEVKELENDLQLNNEVIRHLIVKLPLKYEPKSFMYYQEIKAQVDAEKEEEMEKKRVVKKS